MTRYVYGIFFICSIALAKLPIRSMAGLSDILGEKEKSLSIINGIIEGGKVYNYYFYGKDNDKNHLLAKALFHNHDTQLFPKLLDLSANSIAKIVLELSKLDLEDDLESRLEKIFLEDRAFEDSLKNYPEIYKSIFSTELLPVDKFDVKDFIGFLTGSDAAIILQSFLWLKVENRYNLRHYYEQLGVETNYDWEVLSFGEKGNTGVDFETYEAIKLAQSEISLIPVGLVNINGQYIVDSLLTCLRNFCLILFYNNGNYGNADKIKGLNSKIVNFFRRYPTENMQLSQAARDSWAKVVLSLKLADFNMDFVGWHSNGCYIDIMFFARKVARFFGVGSWYELNKILENVNRGVEIEDDLFGVQNINIRAGTLVFKLELNPHYFYFTRKHIFKSKLNKAINTAWESKKIHIFQMLPNTTKKIKLISEALRNKDISIDEGLFLLGPIDTVYQSYEIAKYMLYDLHDRVPIEFVVKLYQTLFKVDDRITFLRNLHPEQRVALLKIVGKESLEGLSENSYEFIDALLLVLDLIDLPEYIEEGFFHYRSLNLLSDISEYKFFPSKVVKLFNELIKSIKGSKSIYVDYLTNLIKVNKNLEKNDIFISGFAEALEEKIISFKDNEYDLRKLLKFACKINDLELTKMIIGFGVHPEPNEVEVLDLLRKVNFTSLSYSSNFGAAVSEGSKDVVEYYLKNSDDIPNVLTNHGALVFCFAVREEQFEIAAMILDWAGDSFEVNFKDKKTNMSPLIAVVEFGAVGLLKRLLRFKKLKMNRKYINDSRAIHLAIKTLNPEIVRLLVDDKRVDLKTIDYAGRTPLLLAKKYPNDEIVSILEAAKAPKKPSNIFKKIKQKKRLKSYKDEELNFVYDIFE